VQHLTSLNERTRPLKDFDEAIRQ